MDTKKLAERFMALLAGLPRAHGVYRVNPDAIDESKGGKVGGQAITKREPYTVQHWIDHLDGKMGLGIIPIRDDNTVVWGVIDIDRYDIPLEEICERIKDTPLVPVRSKSGGLHIYIFIKGNGAAASFVKRKLEEIAKSIGFGGSEVFPKQVQLMTEAGDVGQWLNMPYFHASKTTRHALGGGGEALSAEAFLDMAEERKIGVSQLRKLIVRHAPGSVDDGPMPDGPPCLQMLSRIGFPSGSRNNGLYNLGVYYKRSQPDDWDSALEEANRNVMQPPLGSGEVQTVIKSLSRTTFRYKCKDQPICEHCDRATCIQRKFGIGDGTEADFPRLHGLVQMTTLPPMYFLNVGDVRVGPITSADLLMQVRFQQVVFESARMAVPTIDKKVWKQVLQSLLNDVQIVEAPEDSSAAGQLFERLQQFIDGPGQTDNKDQLLTGRIYFDGEQYLFRLQDFCDYLARARFGDFKSHEIAARLRERGLTTNKIKVRGRVVSVWCFKDHIKTEPLATVVPPTEVF